MTDFSNEEIVSGTTPSYTATLRDGAGNGLGPSGLTALTLTLRDGLTAEIVNAVSAVNILNTGRGTLSAGGALVITLTAADTAARTTRRRERLRLHIAWTLVGGEAGAHLAEFWVQNPAGTT